MMDVLVQFALDRAPLCVIDPDTVMPGLSGNDFGASIRFLTDYLKGDSYFRIHHPDNNLDRTRFRLECDMDRKRDQMHKIIREEASRAV